MMSAALIFTVSVLSLIGAFRIGYSIILGIVKFFEGLIAVLLAMFILAMWSDPGGTESWVNRLLVFLFETVP